MHHPTVQKGRLELELKTLDPNQDLPDCFMKLFFVYRLIKFIQKVNFSQNSNSHKNHSHQSINHLFTFSNAFAGSPLANTFSFFSRSLLVTVGGSIFPMMLNKCLADSILGLSFPCQKSPPKCCLVMSCLCRLMFSGSTFPSDQLLKSTSSLTPEMSFISFFSASEFYSSNCCDSFSYYLTPSLCGYQGFFYQVFAPGSSTVKSILGYESLMKFRLNSSSLLNFIKLSSVYWLVYFCSTLFTREAIMACLSSGICLIDLVIVCRQVFIFARYWDI